MREKLLVLLCLIAQPNLLPAQLGLEETIITSSITRRQDPQKNLEEKIAATELDLERIERSAGASSPETANAESELADLYLRAGNYERASQLIERALEIRRNSPGGQDRDLAASLHQLAEFHEDLGAFTEAEYLFREALAIRERADPTSVETAATLHALGRLLSKTNSLAEAEQKLRAALAIREQKLPVGDVATAYTLYELAKDVGSKKEHDPEAKELSKRASYIFDTALGKKDPDAEDARLAMEAFGDVLNEKMFGFGMQIEDIPGGPTPEPRTEGTEDQEARRRLFLSGPFNADQAKTLSDEAERLLETGNARNGEIALLMQERSLRIRQRVLGPEHPQTLESLQRLGLAALDQGQYDRALVVARKAMFAETRHLQRVFSFTDEQQRLAFQATVRPFSIFASLPEVPVNDLATAGLRFKGAVLDSLLSERREADAISDPRMSALLARAAAGRQAWTRLEAEEVAAESNDVPAINAKRATLEIESQEIAREFARAGLGSGGLAVSTTTSQVASVLDPGTLLIEYLLYWYYAGKNSWEQRYGAIVLAPSGQPQWIPLGTAKEVDSVITQYELLVHPSQMARDVAPIDDHSDQEEPAKNLLKTLYKVLWAPIAESMPPATQRVIISPDGALNFVSFATLLAPDEQFLAEKVAVSYVASGRDIVVEQPQRSAKTMVICAEPDFIAVKRDTANGFTLDPLPGTGREATALQEMATRLGWNVSTIKGSEATESRIRRIESPQVLHLATHGFFLTENQVSTSNSALKDPMRRAGLAFSGAQDTLNLWKNGKPPPAADDGILTADEVSGMKLKGTWIVTLSACETGLGEAHAGEGVLGLRRGFVEAGAQNLLMTLWSINDDTTVQIMVDFYQHAFATDNPPRALAETQRNWLVKLRKSAGLVQSIRLAGAFILSSQGKP